MKFTKMQGTGNDYVYINCFEETVERPEELAVKVSDRHFGIGSDGLILICPSGQADCRMKPTAPRARCVETESGVWGNTCTTTISWKRMNSMWRQRRESSI